jgi:hypothetical protein
MISLPKDILGVIVNKLWGPDQLSFYRTCKRLNDTRSLSGLWSFAHSKSVLGDHIRVWANDEYIIHYDYFRRTVRNITLGTTETGPGIQGRIMSFYNNVLIRCDWMSVYREAGDHSEIMGDSNLLRTIHGNVWWFEKNDRITIYQNDLKLATEENTEGLVFPSIENVLYGGWPLNRITLYKNKSCYRFITNNSIVCEKMRKIGKSPAYRQIYKIDGKLLDITNYFLAVKPPDRHEIRIYNVLCGSFICRVKVIKEPQEVELLGGKYLSLICNFRDAIEFYSSV